jgi:tetratricopeptide (TPR) repeat protein
LLASGVGAAVRTRHLEYYVELSAKAEPHLFGPDQALWMTRLDAERENLSAAHAWCDEAPAGAELGLRLVRSMKLYWVNRGLILQGYRLTLEALARTRPEERTSSRCYALADAGKLGCFLGRYSEAAIHLQESLEIARELDDVHRISNVLQPLGMACLGTGDSTKARGYLSEALILAERIGNRRESIAACNALAQLERLEGHIETASVLYHDGLKIAREIEDHESIALLCLNLAMVMISRGDPTGAQRTLKEAVVIVDSIGSIAAGQSVLEVSAALAVSREQWQTGARYFGAAEAIAKSTGLERDPADELFLMPFIESARERIGPAAFQLAENSGMATAYNEAIREVSAWLAAA